MRAEKFYLTAKLEEVKGGREGKGRRKRSWFAGRKECVELQADKATDR